METSTEKFDFVRFWLMKDLAAERTRYEKARNNPKKVRIILCINEGRRQNPLRRRRVQKQKRKSQEVFMYGRNENQRSKKENLSKIQRLSLSAKARWLKEPKIPHEVWELGNIHL